MDIFTLTLDDDLKLEPLIATPANEHFAAPSPDGQWLAYTSDESGIPQVYIRPIDGRGARVQVSRDGGMNPIWTPDGSTMYFLTASRMIRSARILLNEKPDIAPTLRIGEITDLFLHTSPHINFDLYPDGDHF
ncbi:MAG: PD40 domain-containing protein, partial [Planctomycetes bacterium]|nr:PD40 domain-containing protein [Planctomycetota bacterium]